jgi:hypothetical protein
MRCIIIVEVINCYSVSADIALIELLPQIGTPEFPLLDNSGSPLYHSRQSKVGLVSALFKINCL